MRTLTVFRGLWTPSRGSLGYAAIQRGMQDVCRLFYPVTACRENAIYALKLAKKLLNRMTAGSLNPVLHYCLMQVDVQALAAQVEAKRRAKEQEKAADA